MGQVVDSMSGDPMSKVSVQNLTTKQGTFTDYRGAFSLEIGDDNYIRITSVGYKARTIHIQKADEVHFLKVKLAFGNVQLKDVVITRPLTDYQLDSIDRARIYEDVFDYQQEKSIQSPISSVYQKFSKKHKDMRRFKEQVIDIENDKFIDTKYTDEVVTKITGLVGDDLAHFKYAYPMAYDFARTASELEIRLWIRYNWEEYKTKTEPRE